MSKIAPIAPKYILLKKSRHNSRNFYATKKPAYKRGFKMQNADRVKMSVLHFSISRAIFFETNLGTSAVSNASNFFLTFCRLKCLTSTHWAFVFLEWVINKVCTTRYHSPNYRKFLFALAVSHAVRTIQSFCHSASSFCNDNLIIPQKIVRVKRFVYLFVYILYIFMYFLGCAIRN